MRWAWIAALGLLACDGTIEVGDADLDQDGFTTADDCDDADASVYPGADELCNGVDDDCNGFVDDEPVDGTGFWVDGDLDGYGNPFSPTTACEASAGLVRDSTDCNDARADVYPDAPELCDGLDNDCDEVVDEDAVDGSTWYLDLDGDGWGGESATLVACHQPAGYLPDSGDCDDLDASVYPGAPELCDGIDSDCQGNPWLEQDPDNDGLPVCAEALWLNTDSSTVSSPLNKDAAGASQAAALLLTHGVHSSLQWTYRTELTEGLLERAGLVVLFGQGDFPLDMNEEQRLLDWVQQGGSLLLFTGWGADTSCPNAELVGLGLICAAEESWSGTAEVVESHPVTDGVADICVVGADPWRVQVPSEVLVQGDYPVLTAAELGAGRVVAMSDEWPMYNSGTGECDIMWGDHYGLVDNTWTWLTDFDLSL